MMKSLILPVLLAVIGTGGGIGAGLALQHSTGDPAPDSCTGADAEQPAAAALLPEPDAARDYARLNNQFVIPVVDDGRIAALVVMSLNVEVRPGTTAAVFAVEPKLRDGFLQIMFDHANIGGFSGNFTQNSTLRVLRNDLLQTARRIVGPDVTDVLITDIVRQDS